MIIHFQSCRRSIYQCAHIFAKPAHFSGCAGTIFRVEDGRACCNGRARTGNGAHALFIKREPPLASFFFFFWLKPLFRLFADSEEAEKPVNGSGVHFSTHFPRSREERRMIDITRDKPIKVTVRVVVPVRDHPKVSGKVTQSRSGSARRLKWRPTFNKRAEWRARLASLQLLYINQSLSFVWTREVSFYYIRTVYTIWP